MPRFILSMSEEQHSQLLSFSQQTGIPAAECVRRSLSLLFAGNETGQVVVSGAIASGCILMVMRNN